MPARKETARIYYGPDGEEDSLYFIVEVRDAKTSVTINGTVADALTGCAGVTVGCALSNVADQNSGAFPHPCYHAAFTKTRALVVEKLSPGGQPLKAVRYSHYIGHIIDMNDTGELKEFVRRDPTIMERTFVLRAPPPTRKVLHTRSNEVAHLVSGPVLGRKAFVPRGAQRRALLAKFANKEMVKQLNKAAAKLRSSTKKK